MRVTMRMRPGRSVMSIRLFGRNARLQGYSSPRATVSTLISPADDEKTCASAGAIIVSQDDRDYEAGANLHVP